MKGRNGPTLVQDIDTLSTWPRVRESRTARSATATASAAAYLDGLWCKVTRVEVELEELSSLVHGEGASVFGV